MNIEGTIKSESLPINSKAMLNRLNELMDEHGTNSLESCKEDVRIRGVLWLLNQQVYGQLATINMEKEWEWLNRSL